MRDVCAQPTIVSQTIKECVSLRMTKIEMEYNLAKKLCHFFSYSLMLFFCNSETLFQALQSTKNTKITNLLTILFSPSPNKKKPG